jgi:hypothetical protein
MKMERRDQYANSDIKPSKWKDLCQIFVSSNYYEIILERLLKEAYLKQFLLLFPFQVFGICSCTIKEIKEVGCEKKTSYVI